MDKNNPNVKVQNWVYNYQSGTNRLAYLATQGLSPQSFGYDANGNLSADVKRGLNSFVYSRNNLPLTYKATGNTDITYGYGSGDQRIYKKTDDHKGNGREEYYLRNLSGSTVGIYNYGSGKWTFDITGYGLIAQKEIDAADFGRPNMPQIVSGLKYFQKDHLGNIRLTYEAGFNRGCVLKYEVISVVDYYPYGKHLRAYFSEEVERYQSTEHERDAESGLDFRGFRMSDSEYGRFVSVDPLAGSFPGMSGYMYVNGNPVGLVDVMGMEAGLPPGGDSDVEYFRSIRESANNAIKWGTRVGLYKSAENLQRYLDGTGETKIEKLEWLKSYTSFNNANKRLDKHFLFAAKALNLEDGMTQELKTNFQAILTGGFNDLYYASGTSHIEGEGNLTVSRNGDQLMVKGLIKKIWKDDYDWNKGQGTYYGLLLFNLDDDQLFDLMEDGASPFELRTYYETSFETSIDLKNWKINNIKYVETEKP